MSTASEMRVPLELRVQRHQYESRPKHHIMPSESGVGWSSYFASWNPTPGASRPKRDGSRSFSRTNSANTSRNSSRQSSRKRTDECSDITGFRNPWPSWHKPTQAEVWRALEWGDDTDPCIEIATSRIKNAHPTELSSGTESNSEIKWPKSVSKQAAHLLRIDSPDFSFDTVSDTVKTTWLGHAGILIQFPPLRGMNRPFRCLFDPIFSNRCSPVQAAGPIRTYAPPCQIQDLPEIDVLMISHNHFDHLDFESVMAIWNQNKHCLRFIVPMANRQWFLNCGIDEDRVTQLDWWDAVELMHRGSDINTSSLKITCTPSQHNSGRSGFDADCTLWSSWYIEYPRKIGSIYRVFFAGDSGYQFHDSPGWPPVPPTPAMRKSWSSNFIDRGPVDGDHPTCPAFEEIAGKLGSPHLLLLPVSVGATYDYFRSFVPLPDAISPFPRHSSGLTAHNHMPPWDAVRVLRLMTANCSLDESAPIAIAMHWGTFVTDPLDVLKTLGQLEWACEAHDVVFARSLDEVTEKKISFLALNHGQSITC